MQELITQEMIYKILKFFEIQIGKKDDSVSFEIQEDGQFILVLVMIDEYDLFSISEKMKNAAYFLNELIPTRKGEYSWMINFKKNGEIFESFFGGNEDSPNSGMP